MAVYVPRTDGGQTAVSPGFEDHVRTHKSAGECRLSGSKTFSTPQAASRVPVAREIQDVPQWVIWRKCTSWVGFWSAFGRDCQFWLAGGELSLAAGVRPYPEAGRGTGK